MWWQTTVIHNLSYLKLLIENSCLNNMSKKTVCGKNVYQFYTDLTVPMLGFQSQLKQFYSWKWDWPLTRLTFTLPLSGFDGSLMKQSMVIPFPELPKRRLYWLDNFLIVFPGVTSVICNICLNATAKPLRIVRLAMSTGRIFLYHECPGCKTFLTNATTSLLC